MTLTDSEMKLKGLEYSFVQDSAAMIGLMVIFRLNSNINQAQREILTKEIIYRCTCHDDLLAACKKAYLWHTNKVDKPVMRADELEKLLKAALAKTEAK